MKLRALFCKYVHRQLTKGQEAKFLTDLKNIEGLAEEFAFFKLEKYMNEELPLWAHDKFEEELKTSPFLREQLSLLKLEG